MMFRVVLPLLCLLSLQQYDSHEVLVLIVALVNCYCCSAAAASDKTVRVRTSSGVQQYEYEIVHPEFPTQKQNAFFPAL